MNQKPNIVMIMVDEMRGDAMGFAGHPDVKTPHLDTLAAQGVYFPNAYSSCPTCIPARAILMTGMTGAHTGRTGYQDGIRWDYPHTLAGELSKAGYYTQCVGKMHVHPLRKMLGFHHIELHDGHLHYYRHDRQNGAERQQYADDYFHWLRKEKGIDCDVCDTGMDCNSWLVRPWPYEEKYHPTNWVTDRSIDFLRRRDRDMPFFLMSSYVRPHAPYDPPQAFLDMYINKPLRPPFHGDWNDTTRLERSGRIYNNTCGPVDPELIRRQQAGYYALITHIDYQIGRLLNALYESDAMDNTILLFLSDHGEMLSDHCYSRKALPYRGSAQIPMILWGPEKWIGPARTDERLVELRDVMPTLLHFAGAPVPDTVDGENMLAPSDRCYLHGEHVFEGESVQFIVTQKDKFIWFSGQMKEQYFRLDLDPAETTNRITDPACAMRIRQMRQWLIESLAGREEGFTDGTVLKQVVDPPVLSSALRRQQC